MYSSVNRSPKFCMQFFQKKKRVTFYFNVEENQAIHFTIYLRYEFITFKDIILNNKVFFFIFFTLFFYHFT